MYTTEPAHISASDVPHIHIDVLSGSGTDGKRQRDDDASENQPQSGHLVCVVVCRVTCGAVRIAAGLGKAKVAATPSPGGGKITQHSSLAQPLETKLVSLNQQFGSTRACSYTLLLRLALTLRLFLKQQA